MKEIKVQWHSGFAAAMDLELRANRGDLVYEKEYKFQVIVRFEILNVQMEYTHRILLGGCVLQLLICCSITENGERCQCSLVRRGVPRQKKTREAGRTLRSASLVFFCRYVSPEALVVIEVVMCNAMEFRY